MKSTNEEMTDTSVERADAQSSPLDLRRKNIVFGLAIFVAMALVVTVFQFSSGGEVTMVASETTTSPDPFTPDAGIIGNDVKNEKEEIMIDQQVETMEKKDATSDEPRKYPDMPPWMKNRPDIEVNWTQWYTDRTHAIVDHSENNMTSPILDKDNFENFLRNRTKIMEEFVKNHPHPPLPHFHPQEDGSTHPPGPAGNNRPITVADGIQYDIIEELSHDPTHFTQGLTFSKSKNILYESTGMYGESKVCKLNAQTGQIIICKDILSRYFAEGLQVYNHHGVEKLIQLTWKEGVGWIRNTRTLEVISQFSFSTTRNEGWGITWDKDSNEFIVSDGSEYLHFWDSETLSEKKRVAIKRQNGSPAKNLNELEFVNGKVLANLWYEDIIVVINPQTGLCEQEYDFSQLWSDSSFQASQGNVLNGISVSPEEGVIYVTGKRWPKIYKLRLRNFT